MADELRNVLSFYSENKKVKYPLYRKRLLYVTQRLDIQKTPDIFIDQRSTARWVVTGLDLLLLLTSTYFYLLLLLQGGQGVAAS